MQHGKLNMARPIPTIFRRNAATPQSNREHGFSLLEVMIALLVLSVGLLGIAGLQTVSLKFNHQSYERSQATLLISEMIEKIAANPVATRAGDFDNVTVGLTAASYVGTYGSCPATCTSTNLARFDIFRWKSAIEDPRRLAQGQGSIARVFTPPIGATTQHVFNVTVTWVENNLLMTQSMQVRTQRTQ